MTVRSETYDDVRAAIDDARVARGERSRAGDGDGDKWPAWTQLVLSVLAIVVSVVLAYSALDKRITVMESKLDDLKQQIGALHR